MRTLAFTIAAALLLAPSAGAFYVAGTFNGWNPAGNLMTDLGGGVWSLDLTLGANERHEYKITTGDWSAAWPQSGNAWFVTGPDGAIRLTYDTNTYADGWRNETRRLGVSTAPTTWTAVGDWQGWNNANPTTAMSPVGGGIYSFQTTLAPGWYQYKAVITGSWDAIGADARSVNADTIWFETTPGNDQVTFWVDALTGTVKVDVVPEPGSAVALASALAGFAGLLLRSRRV